MLVITIISYNTFSWWWGIEWFTFSSYRYWNGLGDKGCVCFQLVKIDQVICRSAGAFLPLDLLGGTEVNRIDCWKTLRALIICTITASGAIGQYTAILLHNRENDITFRTAVVAIKTMLVDFTLIMIIETKTDIVGSASVSNDKVVSRSTLTTV
jgi:hypothetical protein